MQCQCNNETFKVILVYLYTSRESGRTPMWRIVAFTFRSLHKNNSYSTLSRLPIVFLVRGIIGRTGMGVWTNTIPQKGSIIESQRPLVTGPDALVETKFIRIYLDFNQDPTDVASENFTTLLPNRLWNYYILINEEKTVL